MDNVEESMESVVLEQFKKYIKKIDKQLLKSLKRKPHGYAEVQIRVDGDDMRKLLNDYYSKQGYKVTELEVLDFLGVDYVRCLKIEFAGWYHNDKKIDHLYGRNSPIQIY